MASETGAHASLKFSINTFTLNFDKKRMDSYGPKGLCALFENQSISIEMLEHLLQRLIRAQKLSINDPIFGNGFTLLEQLIHPDYFESYYSGDASYKRIHEVFDLLIKLGANPHKRYQQLYSAYEEIDHSYSKAIETLGTHAFRIMPKDAPQVKEAKQIKRDKEIFRMNYYSHMYKTLSPSRFSSFVGTIVGVLLGPIINTLTTAVFNSSLFLNLLTGKVNAGVHLMARSINNRVFAIFGLVILLPLSILIAPLVGAYKGLAQGFDHGFLAAIKPNQYYASSAQSFADAFLRGPQTSRNAVSLRFPRLGHVMLGLFILAAMVVGIGTVFGLPLAGMAAGLVGLTGIGPLALGALSAAVIFVGGTLVSAVVGAFAKQVSPRGETLYEPHEVMGEAETESQMNAVHEDTASSKAEEVEEVEEAHDSGSPFTPGGSGDRTGLGDGVQDSLEPKQ